MLSSMTGYGAGEAEKGGWHYSIQLKTVNNRFLDANFKLPLALWAHEGEVRGRLQKALSRGKLELFWKERSPERGSGEVKLNLALAKSYQKALQGMGRELGLDQELRLEHLLRLPELMKLESEEGAPEEERWLAFQAALTQALDALLASRKREGAALEHEIRRLVSEMRAQAEGIAERSHAMLPQIHEKMKARLQELLGSVKLDEGRLVTELALLSDRSDIREEIVRFRAHLEEFERLLGQGQLLGKQLDFLSQELLREANTMGSKSPDAALTQLVVSLKTEVEKVKEQIQNLE